MATDAPRFNDEQSALIARFLRALAERAPLDELRAFFHPEVEQIELPNPFGPQVQHRDLAGILAAAEEGRKLLGKESYEVAHLHVAGDVAVVELRWQGVTAVDMGQLGKGTTLTAHICQVLELEDGKIRRMRNYDCYERPRPPGN